MQVKDAIKYLSELPEDEEIVIAWWEHDMFDYMCTKEEWEEAVVYKRFELQNSFDSHGQQWTMRTLETAGVAGI